MHPPRQIRLALPEPLASEVRAAIAEQGGLGIEEVDDAWVAIGPDPSAVVWVALVASREEAEAAVAQGAGAVVAWPDTLGLLPSALELAFQQGADRVGHEVMRQAVRSSPAWLEVTGLDLRWLEVSQGFTEGSGYEPSHVIGRTPGDVLRSDLHDPSYLRGALGSLLERGHWRGDVLSRRRDGSIAVTDTSLHQVRLGERPVAMLAARRHAAGAPGGSLFDRIGQAVTQPWFLAREADGEVVECHPSLPAVLGRTAIDQVVGHSIVDLELHCETAGGDYWVADRWFEGRAYEVRCSAHSVGSIGLVLGVLDDVTQRKLQAEEREALVYELQVARDQALAAGHAKSAFLAAMSHDLRTPLNAILGYAELLSEEAHDPSTRNDLERISRSGRHLLGLVNDVLDLARVEAGAVDVEVDHVDGEALLAEVADTIRLRAANRGMQLVVESDGSPLRSDVRRVRQILTNLVANAVKYAMPGRVWLLHADAAFHVVDEGPGLSDEQLISVFEPFHRLQEGGSGVGLGLAISRRIADALGGTLSAEKDPSGGTRFTLDLGPGCS